MVQDRIIIIQHDVDLQRASFQVLNASSKRLYNIDLNKEGFVCSCPDYLYQGPKHHCKHIIHVITRFFGITKDVLADVLDARFIDWSFIQQHSPQIN